MAMVNIVCGCCWI